MDRPNNLMVIDAVVFFDEPVDWNRLVKVLRERLVTRFPIFGQRQGPPGLPLGMPRWEDDPEFSVDRHIHRARLRAPGDDAALQRYIEGQMHKPLDRDRPLWEAHFIDGHGRGAAVFMRFHHALADGIALAQVLLSLSDATPDGDAAEAPARSLVREQPGLGAVASAVRVAAAAPSMAVSAATRVITEVPRLAGGPALIEKVIRQTWLVGGIAQKLLLGHNARTGLTAEPGITKRAVWSRPLPLDEVKQVGRLAGATLNDVLMSSLAGGISAYLANRGDVPQDLTTMVPINTRALDRPLPPELGNRFALVFVRLPTGVSAPWARLAETKRRMDSIKHSPEAAITMSLISAIGRTAKGVERLLVDFFAAKAIGVTTNVAGPTVARYLAGTRITGVLAWVPNSGRQTLGVCIFTYNNTVRVGFKVDAQTVPDPEKLVGAFEREIDTLTRMARAAAGAAPGGTKRAAPRRARP